jgi:mannitol-specific phosphotransferase system IIBC component
MNYSFWQKITSFILIFLFFFSITFRIPLYQNLFVNKVNAKEGNERYNLVSIFVENKIYPEIKGELDRYAKDIS